MKPMKISNSLCHRPRPQQPLWQVPQGDISMWPNREFSRLHDAQTGKCLVVDAVQACQGQAMAGEIIPIQKPHQTIRNDLPRLGGCLIHYPQTVVVYMVGLPQTFDGGIQTSIAFFE